MSMDQGKSKALMRCDNYLTQALDAEVLANVLKKTMSMTLEERQAKLGELFPGVKVGPAEPPMVYFDIETASLGMGVGLDVSTAVINVVRDSLDIVVERSASYLTQALRPSDRKRKVEMAVAALKDWEFDTIVVTGLSGLLIGPAVADALDKWVCIVRKWGEECHSASTVECQRVPHRWVFLDDIIETGKTLARVQDAVKEEFERAVYVGRYTYNDDVIYKEQP